MSNAFCDPRSIFGPIYRKACLGIALSGSVPTLTSWVKRRGARSPWLASFSAPTRFSAVLGRRCVIDELAGDSHMGGQRPLRISDGESTAVLKFAEPRAYQLLADVSRILARATGLIAPLPAPLANNVDENWYIIPYFPEEPIREDEYGASFMRSYGALAAFAYAMWMVDLHLENVIVSGGYPIIIDPECILYLVDDMSDDDRLMSTGILSHNANLSALRGGTMPLASLRQFVDATGVLRFKGPASGLRNRLALAGGGYCDPARHKLELLNGFREVYSYFVTNATTLTEIVVSQLTCDFRIRCLVRKTPALLDGYRDA